MGKVKNTSINIDLDKIPAGYDRDNDYGVIESLLYESNGRKITGSILRPNNLIQDKKYPVLYLIHGMGSNGEWSNNRQGRTRQIIGNMVSKDTISQMIVIMPDIIFSQDIIGDYLSFRNVLIDELIPFVEKEYPVLTGWENRAIAGNSLGGMAVLYYAYSYYKRMNDTFRFIGALSPSALLFPNSERGDKGWIHCEKDFVLGNPKKSCIFIGSGTNDVGIKIASKHYSDVLIQNGTSNIHALLPNGKHDWDAFRKLFYVFMSYDFFRK